MCTRVSWNTNDIAVLTGRSMDWPESTATRRTARFAQREIGF
jgi:penicillin V acylase-like amidase (Ntn superfamily)